MNEILLCPLCDKALNYIKENKTFKKYDCIECQRQWWELK